MFSLSCYLDNQEILKKLMFSILGNNIRIHALHHRIAQYSSLYFLKKFSDERVKCYIVRVLVHNVNGYHGNRKAKNSVIRFLLKHV